MIKFLKKSVLLIGIVVLCFCAFILFDLCIVGSQYELNYQAALTDKLDRLKSIDEPKIILVGHSNLAFGIDSQQIEDALSMPVVNLGLHGGLGNAFHEEIAKPYIGEGDIVVICHSDFGDGTIDGSLAWVTAKCTPEAFPTLWKIDPMAMVKAYPEHLKRDLALWATHTGNRQPKDHYARNSFNIYGDLVYKPSIGQMDTNSFFSQTAVSTPSIDDACIERLNRYARYVREQGAIPVIAGYPIAYGEYSTCDADDFQAFEEMLRSALECDVISNYTDYFYPYDYFYDTALHLTEEGAAVRTLQLITDLRTWAPDRFDS